MRLVPRRVTLGLRFTLVIVATIVGVAATLGGYFINQQRRTADEVLRSRAASLATSLAYNSEYGAFVGNREILRRYAQGVMREPDAEYILIEGRGGTLATLGHFDHLGRRGAEGQPAEGDPASPRVTEYTDHRGVHLVEAAAPILLRSGSELEEESFLTGPTPAPGSQRIGTVSVGLSGESSRQKVRMLQQMALLITSAITVLGMAVAILFVRRIVGPIKSLLLGTQRIAKGDLAHRVEIDSNDEIGELAESFNGMTGDLGRARSELEAYSSELGNKVRERTRKLEEAQSRLVQSEKLSAIGQLVAGVAHELNNPLTGVLGYAQLLLRREKDPDGRRALERIDSEATRCKKIVQNLLTFARKQKTAKTLIDLNTALERALELRAYQMRLDNIEVVTELQRDLPQTMADFHQMQQAFLNIIVNAHQAMGEVEHRGRLVLRSRAAGDRIVVELEDNGPGIPAALRERIFDPFFTTKEVGVGTGLGLSICYGIMEEHGGRITVASEPGQWTRFTVELPIVGTAGKAEAASAQGRAPAGLPPGPAPVAGPRRQDTLRVLIVDDEPSVVEILYQALGPEGFQIDTAASGSAALSKIVKHKFDLIITDLRMPGMGGAELYQRVKDLDPLLAGRMMFTTGDTVSPETQLFLERTGSVCIEKPFTLEQVRDVVLKHADTLRRSRVVVG